MKKARILCMFFFVVQLLTAQNKKAVNANTNDCIVSETSTIQQLIQTANKISQQDTSCADRLFRKAIEKALKHNDLYNAGQAYHEMGEMYFSYNNHNKALGGFINAKKYFTESKSDNEIALTNFKIGRAQYYRGNYRLSGGHLSYAMQLAKQLQLKKLEADILEYMGLLYHVMPNLTLQSTQALRKSLEIKHLLNDQKGALRILEKLSEVYYDQKKFDSAFYFNSKAISLAEALKLSYDANLCRLSRVSLLLRLGNKQKAREALDFIKTHLLDSADVNVVIRYMIQAGNYDMAVSDTLSAQKKYDTAIQIAHRAGFPEMFTLVYESMSDAYYHHKDYERAYQYQVLYADKLVGLFSENSFTTLKELEYILKTNSTEDEVRILNIQNEAKALQLRNERTVRLILMIAAAGFLFSGIVIFTLYRKQKRKSTIIEKKDAELRTLMKEMHHRVKNNLQVISSFLDLQLSAIGEGLAAEAVKESRNRVQTMALIHQDLYREGNTEKTGMEDYVRELVQNLFMSYNVKKNSIRLKTKTDRIALDSDTMMLIGLVLNELISNSLKYAFCNKESGLLMITMQQSESMEELVLEVKDDGVGFPPGLDIDRSGTLGYKLIKAFAHKLKADVEIFNNNGACVRLYIKKYQAHSYL